MTRFGQRAALGAVLAFSVALSAAPAVALEIFGVRLWGRDDPEDAVEVIDPLPYTATFTVEPENDELERSLRAASGLWVDRESPAPGRAGLISRARGDYRRILAALYNAGYYGPEISILVAGREAADLTLDVALPPEVPVAIRVAPGPRFRFGAAEIANAPPWRVDGPDALGDPQSVGFASGETARAGAVGQAASLAVETWRQRSHAKAREAGRDVVADHSVNRLDVRIAIDPGRPARYGPTIVQGSERVDPEFIAVMANLTEGDAYDPEGIEDGRARLARLGTFRSIRIEEAEEIGPDGRLPMFVRVEDRAPRTIGFGGTVSTLDGLGLEAFWQHRNLLGRAEQLRVDASVLGLGEADSYEDLNYTLGVSFVKPGVLTPDTNFVTSLVGSQQDFDTYRERSVTGRIGFSQIFGRYLTGDLFLEASRARVRDDFGVRRFTTVGPYVRAQYDRRDDPVDATEGYFLLADARPFYEAEFGNVALRSTLEGRAYLSVDADSRFVLAGRARVGNYWGPDAAESPPNLLFFAGGGGSVRGYAFRSIGVEVPGPDGEAITVGGRSLGEASGEIRARFGERFGVVGFVDAGLVSPDSNFGGDVDWQLGAGAGIRYFTGFGPLRVDVAAPIDRRPQDSAVALYIGIGQAF